MREAAKSPGFLAGVLDYLLANEPLLIAFAADRGMKPASIAAARMAMDEPRPMTTLAVSLDGTTDLPAGKIAMVVTFLAIERPPPGGPDLPGAEPDGSTVTRLAEPTVAGYRALYRAVGEDWLWFSRAIMADAALQKIISAPTTDILVLRQDGKDIGIAEFDFADAGNAEIVSFGVVREAYGTGAAGKLMRTALAHAFGRDPATGRNARRVWLHTCTADHPGAVRFYRKMGFRPYKVAIEIADDPRLDGTLRADAAPAHRHHSAPLKRRRLVGVRLVALGRMLVGGDVALRQRLDLGELRGGFVEGGLGRGQLILQRALGSGEVITPLRRGLGEGRIGEMAGVVDAGAFLLGDDLVVQILRHALELGDHAFDLRDLTPLLLHLKPLKADSTLARLHGTDTPYTTRHFERARPPPAASFAELRPPFSAVANLSFTSGVNHGGEALNSG